MTENEIREYIAELRHNANMLIKSGYATTGISTHFNKSADLIEELLAYRAIGTVEQCRGAVEKMKPKKPNYEGDGYYNGELVLDTWICPNCENQYEVDYEEHDYCPKCGQHIDHSTLTEDD